MTVSVPHTNLSIGIGDPAKDVVVSTVAPVSGPNTITIWSQLNVNVNKTQSIIGHFTEMMDQYFSRLSSESPIQTLSMLPGDPISAIVTNRSGLLTSDDYLAILIGTPDDENATARTGMVGVAFKQLLNKWLEINQ